METSVRSEYRDASWTGAARVEVRQKIVEGPQAFLDRRVILTLTFEQIDELAAIVAMARNRLVETQKRIDAANKANES